MKGTAMHFRHLISIAFMLAGVLAAQDAAPPAGDQASASKPDQFTIDAGTKLPMNLINSVSTKHSMEGDRVYLETAFPIQVNGHIVIPVGSYVAGTITEVKKPGRVKGRGEIYVRFDTLTLPNGVTREFKSRMGSVDANSTGNLDRAEGKVQSEGNKAGDTQTVAEVAAQGASIGTIVGAATHHIGTGLAGGAAAGAAAGLIWVLTMRGPDAVLAKGSTIEMVLDRPLRFSDGELNFGNYQPPRMSTPAFAPSQGPRKDGMPYPIK